MILVAFLNTLRLAKLIEGALATVGAFLVGYVLVALLGWLFDKYLLKRKSPELLHRVCRLLGGLILAILVAMMLFGGGGGSGDGTGDGAGTGTASPGPASNVESTDPKAVAAKVAPPVEVRVRVLVLGGTDVKDQKFYVVDDDPAPLAFADAKSAIQRKKDATAKSVGLEIRFPVQNALPRDHPAIAQLARWAGEVAGLTVTFPAEAP
ncbi:MAG: hypothetical protein JNK93_03510 [Planctomycetia bacterium]|nr:hypothetical protein [Planctomycetia bacterium]